MAPWQLTLASFVGYLHLAFAASSTTSSSSSAASPTAFSSWVIPLNGLTDQISNDWGAGVVSAIYYPATPVPYTIVINNNLSQIGLFDGGPELPLLSNTTEPLYPDSAGSLNPPVNDQHQLILGINSAFNVTLYPTTYPRVKTVPFGLNIGRQGVWKGSLVVAGSYDANRTASTHWTQVSDNVEDSFLANGTLALPTVDISTCSSPDGTGCGSSSTMPATLDFNNDALELPNGFSCNSSLAITLKSGAESIIIPANLTANSARCTSGDALVLGKPFFQAAYIYVDGDHALYTSRANQYDLDPQSEIFNPTATIAPVAAPPSNPTATPTSAGTLAHGVSISLAGSMALFVLISLGQ